MTEIPQTPAQPQEAAAALAALEQAYAYYQPEPQPVAEDFVEYYEYAAAA